MQPLRPLPELSPTGAVWRGAVTALLIALPVAVAVLVTNDRWGFTQEPYRFLAVKGVEDMLKVCEACDSLSASLAATQCCAHV